MSTPTGYADHSGNIWTFNDGGHTVIDGKTVRGRPGRRMLQPGEAYYDTRGELRYVPGGECPDCRGTGVQRFDAITIELCTTCGGH